MEKDFVQEVFNVSKKDFSHFAIDLFNFQYRNNPIYKAYVDSVHISPEAITSIQQIPFLPISFFKTHTVQTTDFNPEVVFESSGTTQTVSSKHHVKNIRLYRQDFM